MYLEDARNLVPAAVDLSTSAAQASHYRDVRARLRGNAASEPDDRAKLLQKPVLPPKVRDFIFVQLDPLYVSPTALALRWREIVRQVCAKHGVGEVDIMSGRRAYKAVFARQEAMYRLRHETSMTLPEIGRRLGGKDHTTVAHGIARHAERMAKA